MYNLHDLRFTQLKKDHLYVNRISYSCIQMSYLQIKRLSKKLDRTVKLFEWQCKLQI